MRSNWPFRKQYENACFRTIATRFLVLSPYRRAARERGSSARSGRRTPHDRARETVADLARYQLPVPIIVTTRGSIGLNLFASDRDRLLKFPARSALLVRALAGDHGRPLGRRTRVGGIVPSDPSSNTGCLERPMGRFTGLAARGLIQRGADFPPDGCAEDRADCRRDGLAATLAKLVADDCADCSTNESTCGFVLAYPTATSEKHCQGEARAHTDSATANRVCCLEHDVFPLIDDQVQAGPVSRDGPHQLPAIQPTSSRRQPVRCLRRSRSRPTPRKSCTARDRNQRLQV